MLFFHLFILFVNISERWELWHHAAQAISSRNCTKSTDKPL